MFIILQLYEYFYYYYYYSDGVINDEIIGLKTKCINILHDFILKLNDLKE